MHIIFDLDETLIYSLEYSLINKFDASFPYFEIKNFENNKIEYKTFIRPFTFELLNWVGENAKMSFWSSGEKSYVLDIIKNLVKDQSKIFSIFWRDHCEMCEKDTGYIKKIDWIVEKIPEMGNYGEIILIDDLDENIQSNFPHTIQVPQFDLENEQDYSNDTTLFQVLNVLQNKND